MSRRRRPRSPPAPAASEFTPPRERCRRHVLASSGWGIFYLLCSFFLVLGLLADAATSFSTPRGTCTDPNSFCFQSTSLSFLSTEDRVDGLSPKTSARDLPCSALPFAERPSVWPVSFTLPGGSIVTCSLVDAGSSQLHDRTRLQDKGPASSYDIGLCQQPHVPDNWMRASNGVTEDLDDGSQVVHDGEISNASPVSVEISPPQLDWGTNSLYSASVAFLTVTNKNREKALHIDEPFSTNPQFYTYGYENLVLQPGENTSIPFVFLPRLMGLSSGHLVLQTSVGGFVIQAKGLAVESSFKIEPLIGLDIAVDSRLKRSLSIYNPFNDSLSVEEVAVWMESGKQSSHIVCLAGKAQKEEIFTEELYAVGGGDSSLPIVDIRPRERWEVLPHQSNDLLELRLQPRFEGKIIGAICMKLRERSTDSINTIVIPLELEVCGKAVYYDSTGSVSASFEPIMACDKTGLVFLVSLKNDASQLLSVSGVVEENEKGEQGFQIKFMKGLLLFPGSSTVIALIRYTYKSHSESEERFLDALVVDSKCGIAIQINISTDSFINIPCQDLVRAAHMYLVSSVLPQTNTTYVDVPSEEGKDKATTASMTEDLASILQDSSDDLERTFLTSDEAVDRILGNWRSHGMSTGVSMFNYQELQFPVVQVGSHESKWITVHNPSQSAALVQLVLQSHETIDQCKPADVVPAHTFISQSTEINSTKMVFGFSLSDSSITEAYLLPSESASFGPIIFRPSSRCTWSSLALVRSNVTGVEMLPLRAYGGSHHITLLERTEPVWKLEFSFDFLVKNTSLLLHKDSDKSPCVQRLSKEIHVKNTGELPLEVKRIKVSSADCGVDGFRVENCQGFSLAPTESLMLQVSYLADFSSPVVNRDLELLMTTGIFVIPMTASIPVDIINRCGSAYQKMVRWKMPIILCIAALFLLMIIRVAPHSFPVSDEDCYIKIDGSKNPDIRTPSFLPQSGKILRLQRDLKENDGTRIEEYPIHENGSVGGLKRSDKASHSNNDNNNKASALPTQIIRTTDEIRPTNAALEPNLTIRVTREKGRRRKRKGGSGSGGGGGTGLTSKFEVSSNHSGNSTPSSPVSPNSATSKSNWPLSPEAIGDHTSRLDKQKHQKNLAVNPPGTETVLPAAVNDYESNWPPVVTKERQPVATLPSENHISPMKSIPSHSAVTANSHVSPVPFLEPLASSSPIALHARAPGSNLTKTSAPVKTDGEDLQKELTYDIWGNHFTTGHLLSKLKEAPCTSAELGSTSFFAMMPATLPVLQPGAKLSPPSSTVVTNTDEMN